ncbi:MAG: hypothetical protein ACFFEN_02350 [Candidatus Thorarchaeota archaeon]
MLKAIKEFLFNLNPDMVIQAPSRINIINPLDAVEGDFWMPSVAINGKNNPLSAFLYLKKLDGISRVKIYGVKKTKTHFKFNVISEEIVSKNIGTNIKNLIGQQKLIYAGINRLCKMNSWFNKRFLKSNMEIGLLTTIPRQSGLGGSSAIIIAVIYGLALYFNLYNNLNVLEENEFHINKDIIAEIAMRVEDKDLKITGGYSDRYVISRGGLCFCSYRGKLYHKEISNEPLAIYDRIDETYNINHLPIIVCYSGMVHESGNVHRILRELYLKQHPQIIENYRLLAEISWKSRYALMNHNWKQLGEYFEENTQIMDNIMTIAGFKYGIGLVNNILIKLIKEHNEVYGAKLTGAGNGGSVFALVNPDKIETICNFWRNQLYKIVIDAKAFSLKFPKCPLSIREQLKHAQFFQIVIDKSGVKKI